MMGPTIHVRGESMHLFVFQEYWIMCPPFTWMMCFTMNLICETHHSEKKYAFIVIRKYSIITLEDSSWFNSYKFHLFISFLRVWEKDRGKNKLLILIYWGYFHFGLFDLESFNLVLEFFNNFHFGPCCHLSNGNCLVGWWYSYMEINLTKFHWKWDVASHKWSSKLFRPIDNDR